MIKYGLQFPDDTNEVAIELWCYRAGHPVSKGGLGAAGHMKRAARMLFPEYDQFQRPVFVWHEWTERRLEAWCSGDFQTWWGPAASAKSTDAAMLLLVDWYADPSRTTTIVCSTTIKMLKRRIFGEIARLHAVASRLFLATYKQRLPGEYSKSRVAIMLSAATEAEESSEKSGIFGFAIQQGDKKKARDDIIGQHNARIRLLVDEAQHPDTEVAFDARANLMKGCENFKLVAFGNPDSRLTPLGRYSEPEAGWESINDQMTGWKTKLGYCHYFDGMKSPALKRPSKYFFLIKKADIEKQIADTGFDSPDYWQFCRGFVRPEGTAMQIISETFAIKNQMMAKPEWVSGFIVGAGFDPSYSAGGDRRVLVPFQVGLCTWGSMVISYLDPLDIFIEAGKLAEKTFSRQMAEKVIEHCQSLGVEKKHFGMDSTGAQTVLADVIDEMWPGPGKIYRCEFGGAPSDLNASDKDSKPSVEVYANRVTELWFNMVTFAKFNQIRNIPHQALREFCIRELLSMDKMRMRTTKRQIETKSQMKTRTGGKSPDEADACCIGLDVVRTRMGIHPGASASVQPTQNRADDRFALEMDLDNPDKLYLTGS